MVEFIVDIVLTIMTIFYNITKLKVKRKYLRNNSTKAEILLWKQLSRSKLYGLKFRRQHSIGHYILDFYCPEKRVAIELDGSAHGSDDRKKYDRERQRFIESCGIEVLRFYNDQVTNNIGGVLASILETCGSAIDHPRRADAGYELDKKVAMIMKCKVTMVNWHERNCI